MKKYLLPEGGRFYKANLHCHSTVSDGRWTPEEIKNNYKEHGYSVVAYTDHDVFVTHNELADESFLPMNGYELAFAQPKIIEGKSSKVCHVCFVSLEKDKKAQKIFYNCRFLEKNKDIVCIDTECEPIDRLYSTEFISDVMRKGAEEGFFVTYNHPVWSLETKDEYCNYHGMHAMEVVNYGCVVEGYDDRNANIYDQMLREGEKIYCVATDDNHNRVPIDHPENHSFGGFTMIKAEKLDYESISRSLLDGSFYSSEGPLIHDLYFEDNKVYIETSDAVRITMTAANRHYKVATADKNGKTISNACFEINSDLGDYVRFTIKEASTNAYFLSELLTSD